MVQTLSTETKQILSNKITEYISQNFKGAYAIDDLSDFVAMPNRDMPANLPKTTINRLGEAVERLRTSIENVQSLSDQDIESRLEEIKNNQLERERVFQLMDNKRREELVKLERLVEIFANAGNNDDSRAKNIVRSAIKEFKHLSAVRASAPQDDTPNSVQAYRDAEVSMSQQTLSITSDQLGLATNNYDRVNNVYRGILKSLYDNGIRGISTDFDEEMASAPKGKRPTSKVGNPGF